MRQLIWLSVIWLTCTQANASILSVTFTTWEVAHNVSYDYSFATLDPNTSQVHGSLSQTNLTLGTVYDYSAVGQLTTDLTDNVPFPIEFTYAGQTQSWSEIALVDMVQHKSSYDFFGYSLTGYRLSLSSVPKTSTIDTVNIELDIFGEDFSVPEPTVVSYFVTLGILLGCLSLGGRCSRG